MNQPPKWRLKVEGKSLANETTKSLSSQDKFASSDRTEFETSALGHTAKTHKILGLGLPHQKFRFLDVTYQKPKLKITQINLYFLARQDFADYLP